MSASVFLLFRSGVGHRASGICRLIQCASGCGRLLLGIDKLETHLAITYDKESTEGTPFAGNKPGQQVGFADGQQFNQLGFIHNLFQDDGPTAELAGALRADRLFANIAGTVFIDTGTAIWAFTQGLLAAEIIILDNQHSFAGVESKTPGKGSGGKGLCGEFCM